MRKLLLASGAALALSFSTAQAAGPNDGLEWDVAVALALGVNITNVTGNNSSGTGLNSSAAIASSIGSNRGVVQVNQNAGVGSALQNTTAASYLTGVQTDGGFNLRVVGAAAGNAGTVSGNTATMNYTWPLPSNSAGAGISGSINSNVGITSVNNNAGANSALQNSTAAAAIQICGSNCADIELSGTIALAGNAGSVLTNGANQSNMTTAASITSGSILSNVGVVNVNNNAGANSLLQNSVAVGALYPH